ncbi:MAG: hypothetical protein MRY63_00780 [Neomegalonema sp.]|nr:hypothetical protein [Neomegalonema sp.]
MSEIAAASSEAAKSALKKVANDPVFEQAVWILLNAPLAARSPGFLEDLSLLGVQTSQTPALFDLTAAINASLDRLAAEQSGKTDFGEMAQQALVGSLIRAIEPQLPTLLEATPEDTRTALGRLAGGDRFAQLARDFFGDLLYRTLDSFLSRELANHVGADQRFASDAERRAFEHAFRRHCSESARIVESYSGDWYGKHVWQKGEFGRAESKRFAQYALKKLRAELERRDNAA